MPRTRTSSPLFSLFFAVVFLTSGATALAASPTAYQNANTACQSYAHIPVKITPVFDEPKLDVSMSLATLQNYAKNGGAVIPHYDSITLGLASYKSITQFLIPIMHYKMPNGTFCARVQNLEARIGYENVTIHIANEFPQGSCSFYSVLEHEQKHVQVNRALLHEYVPKIKARLDAFLKINGMFIVANPDYADKLLRERVSKITEEVIQEMTQENRRRQKLIDSPQEYAKNNTACQGAVARIADKFRRTR